MYIHGVYSACGTQQSPFLTLGNYERYFDMTIYSFTQQTLIEPPERRQGDGAALVQMPHAGSSER